jgi:hypothetical protein
VESTQKTPKKPTIKPKKTKKGPGVITEEKQRKKSETTTARENLELEITQEDVSAPNDLNSSTMSQVK